MIFQYIIPLGKPSRHLIPIGNHPIHVETKCLGYGFFDSFKRSVGSYYASFYFFIFYGCSEILIAPIDVYFYSFHKLFDIAKV